MAKAILSLLLLVPMPSLAILIGMVWYPDTAFGQGFFAFAKLWILALPVIWLRAIEGATPKFAKPRPQGLLLGLFSGLLIAVVIVLAWGGIGRAYLDPQILRGAVAGIGLDSPSIYLLMAAYWIVINSLIEEYIWRWFVVRQCRKFLPPVVAILVAAAGFTLHHVIALSLYLPPSIVALASCGVFVGGVIWSWMYLRYGSIWPGYISHALADLAIFVIGYRILFGG